MQNTDTAAPRKPLLSIECDTKEQKAFFTRVAKTRGVTLSALVRLLLLDEGRRLGLEAPEVA